MVLTGESPCRITDGRGGSRFENTPVTGHPNWEFSWFSSTLQATAGTAPWSGLPTRYTFPTRDDVSLSWTCFLWAPSHGGWTLFFVGLYHTAAVWIRMLEVHKGRNEKNGDALQHADWRTVHVLSIWEDKWDKGHLYSNRNCGKEFLERLEGTHKMQRL
jgi:hypothetical protein